MDKYYHHDSEVTIAVNDLDFMQHIKPGAVMRFYQDIATEHAVILGYSYDDMIKKNLLWVILRMSVKIIKHPKLGETYKLRTFPEKPTASSVDRSYYMYDKTTGEIVTCGSSRWCVIDAQTHRIQRCAPLFENFDQELFIPDTPFDGVNPKIGKLPDGSISEKIYTGMVHITDLDRNIHMNNACYGDIILNAFDIETLKERYISHLDINFISQLFCGDTYDVCRTQIDGITHIEAKKAEGDVIFRARAEWSDN